MRVVVAEDEVVLRAGLVSLLGKEGFEVTAEVDSGRRLLGEVKVNHSQIDLVLADIRMPGEPSGIQVAIEIRKSFPDIGVVLHSNYVEEAFAMELIGDDPAGVGYLLKDRVQDVDYFVESLRRVAEGGSVIDPAVVSALLKMHQGSGSPLKDLTDRERDVLALIAEGLSNRAIAHRLVLEESTVERHNRHLFRKLGLEADENTHRRVLAVIRYLST